MTEISPLAWLALFLSFLGAGVLPVLAFGARSGWGRAKTTIAIFGLGPVLLAAVHIGTLGRPWLGAAVLAAASLGVLHATPGAGSWLRSRALPLLSDAAAAGVIGLAIASVEFSAVWAKHWVHNDVMWHIGFVAELREHFPPVDPHWSVDKVLEYHWLPHAVLAAMAAASGQAAADTVLYVAPAPTYIAIFACAAQLVPARSRFLRYGGALVFCLVFGTTFLPTWMVQRSLASHLGPGMSTYMWSLPATLAAVYWWVQWDRKRRALPSVHWRSTLPTLGATLLFVLLACCSKGSHALLFGGLELGALLLRIAQQPRRVLGALRSRNGIGQLLLLATTYLAVVLALLALRNLAFPNASADIIARVEALDYKGLERSSFLLAALDFWFVLAVVAWPWWKTPARGGAMFLAAVINFVGFRTLDHPGYADVYFAFNAVLLSAIAVLLVRSRFSLGRVALALVLAAGGAHALSPSWGSEPNLITSSWDRAQVLPPGSSLRDGRLAGLQELRSSLGRDALVSVPFARANSVEYAALLEARTWAAASRFALSTTTHYARHRGEAREDPKQRKRRERYFVRWGKNWSAAKCRERAALRGWTHVLLPADKVDKDATCLQGLRSEQAGDWVLFHLVGEASP